MEYNSGIFTCPKCHTKKMSIYTNWLKKKIYNNNNLEEQWILYYKNRVKEQFECTFFTKEYFNLPFELLPKIFEKIDHCCSSDDCFCDDFFPLLCCYFMAVCLLASIPFLVIFYIFYIIFCILIFFWIDCCRYLCKKETRYIYLNPTNFRENLSLVGTEDNNILNDCEGVSEHELLQEGNFLFVCNNCNWNGETFFEFIPNFNTDRDLKIDNSTINVGYDTIDETNLSSHISIIFSPENQAFLFSVISPLNKTFEFMENKLYKEYPNLKNKKLIFLCKGNIISDKKKTLAELNLKNSDIIIFYENS